MLGEKVEIFGLYEFSAKDSYMNYITIFKGVKSMSTSLDRVTNVVKIDSHLEVYEEESFLMIFNDDVSIGVYHSHFDNRVFITIRKDGKDLYKKSF